MPCCTETLLPTDRETVEILTRAIRRSTGGLIRGLHVESFNNQIHITGSTDLYYHKQLVTRAVMEICDVNFLHNNIVVSRA